MSLDEVKALMKEAGWGMLATTDGEKVGCRPIGGWTWVGAELWCATFTPSDKVAQLEKVPYGEYCFADKEGKHVRISGPCAISTNNDEKLTVYEAVPELKNYIQDPAAPQYVVIKMKPDRIRMMAGTDLSYQEIALA
jgi:general stress protein 26